MSYRVSKYYGLMFSMNVFFERVSKSQRWSFDHFFLSFTTSQLLGVCVEYIKGENENSSRRLNMNFFDIFSWAQKYEFINIGTLKIVNRNYRMLQINRFTSTNFFCVWGNMVNQWIVKKWFFQMKSSTMCTSS